jgi:hypothetical protein
MSDKEKAEPSTKWVDSEARKLLREQSRIIEGKVPAAAKDADGNATVGLQTIYVVWRSSQT